VPAITKAARLLEVVGHASRPLGVSELARRCDMSKSTAHGIVIALMGEDFLQEVDGNKAYVLGPRLVELGTRAAERQLLTMAFAELERLATASGETVLFGRLRAGRVEILACREGGHALHLSAPVGSTVAALAGALGKAHLAILGDDEARKLLAAQPLPSYTERSVTDVEAYLRQVREARRRGYATERGEYLPGVVAAASAFTWLGTAYVLWTVGFEASRTEAELKHLGEECAAAARRMAEALTSQGSVRSAS
jgi:IclR family acetate operon transcriptional repressor